jgi:hypothetical protein
MVASKRECKDRNVGRMEEWWIGKKNTEERRQNSAGEPRTGYTVPRTQSSPQILNVL